MSSPYINVVQVEDSSDQLGKVRAKIGMDTNFGRITAITGSILDIGSGNNQGRARVYAWKSVNIGYSQATGFYDFPTGADCLVIGHDSQFPKPNPSGATNFTTYLKTPNSIQSYDRGG